MFSFDSGHHPTQHWTGQAMGQRQIRGWAGEARGHSLPYQRGGSRLPSVQLRSEETRWPPGRASPPTIPLPKWNLPHASRLGPTGGRLRAGTTGPAQPTAPVPRLEHRHGVLPSAPMSALSTQHRHNPARLNARRFLGLCRETAILRSLF